MPNHSLNRGRTALITGSSAGIGAQIAIRLASDGFSVVITGRDINKLTKVVDECRKAAQGIDSQVELCVADLDDTAQVDYLVAFVASKFSKLDLLVNNACWRGKHRDILDHDAIKDFRDVMHINVSIPLYLIRKSLIHLTKRDRASDKLVVVNISSIASQIAVPLHSYSISKACLAELSKQLAQIGDELGLLSITIAPGPVSTEERPHHQAMAPLTLLGRIGTRDDIAELVMFAFDNASLLNGQELNIDGGYIAKHKEKFSPRLYI